MRMICFQNRLVSNRNSRQRPSLGMTVGRWFSFVLLTAFGASLAFPSFVQAQKKYTPEHPDVKKMADRAVKTLQKGGKDHGQNTLAALAIVEHGKRYAKKVPKGNKVVDSAVAHIRKECASGSFLRERETYYPALALILLAEVDAARNREQIGHLLDVLKERQKDHGGYTYKGKDTGDCSQTQFAGLAMWVAKSHGFDVNIKMAKDTLTWFCDTSQGGQWSYMYNKNGKPQKGPTLSMQAAGISSVYLLADLLQLKNRVYDVESNAGATDGLGLPATVQLYVPPVEGQAKRSTGPLTKFDKSLLGSTIGAGNRSFESVFTYSYPRWNFYYLYALERYCYFRQQAEGHLGGGKFKDWYDGGVDFLATKQADNGSFSASKRGVRRNQTAFAVLFLVRSSEIISLPPAEGATTGGEGFGDGTLTRTDGAKIVSSEAEQNLAEMMKSLQNNQNLSSEQLQRINESLKKQIVEFRNKDDKSRAEIQGFLRQMVGAKNYYRRLIAVRFLAGEQDMDNVPGLIYAVSDPDFRIAFEAHQGLRLISRKIDSMKLSETTIKNARRDPGVLKQDAPEIASLMRSEFKTMEQRWSDWFLKIRPNAQLYKQDEPEVAGAGEVAP